VVRRSISMGNLEIEFLLSVSVSPVKHVCFALLDRFVNWYEQNLSNVDCKT